MQRQRAMHHHYDNLHECCQFGFANASLQMDGVNMRSALLFPLILLNLIGILTLAAAQDLVVDVNLRILDVFVEDEHGRPVTDLAATDFEVLEGGQMHPVKHLTLESEPVDIGLVVDRSSSIRQVQKQLDRAVMNVLKAADADDRAFLMTFAGEHRISVSLTAAHSRIFEALKGSRLAYGTRVYDALVDSLQYLSTSGRNRKILIIFSDGADHYSAHTFAQLADTAAFYGFPIYSFGYAGDDSRTLSQSGLREIKEQFAELASLTEGKSWFAATETDCSAAAGLIFQRARYQYRLGFYSTELSGSSGVQVRLHGKKSGRVIIRTDGPKFSGRQRIS
jgi:VWFA-related protein